MELLEKELQSPRTDLFIDAASSGQRRECQRRLERGQAVDAKQSVLGYTALHSACDYGYLSVVKLLVAWDADIQVERDSDGNSPLHCAAENGHAHVVKYLIDCGADKTRVNKDGFKAYDLALDQDYTKMLYLLREPPAMPESLLLSNISSRDATLRWKKPRDNGAAVDEYEILVMPVDGVQTLLEPQTCGKPQFYTCPSVRSMYHFDGILYPATTYLVSVRAHNSAGWSDRSSEVKLATRPDVPLEPAQPAYAGATSVSMTLEWDAPKSNSGAIIYNYEVQMFPGPGATTWVSMNSQIPGAEIEIVKKGTGQYREDRELRRIRYTVEGLSPGTEYTFRIRAQNKCGWGEFGPESAKLATRPPATAVDIRARSCLLEWGDVSSSEKRDLAKEGVEKWELQMARYIPLRKEKWETVADDIITTHLAVTKLTPSTNYLFRVRPYIAIRGWDPWDHSAVSEVIKTKPTAPEEPQQPLQADATHESITLRWSAPCNNGKPIDCYALRICKQRGLSEWSLVSDAIRGQSYTVEGLKSGAKYLFMVRAHNELGWSTFSATSESCSTRALPPPHAPELVRKADSFMYMRWIMPPTCTVEVECYELEMRAIEDGEPLSWECIGENLADPNFMAKELAPVTEYEFRTRAKLKNGDEWSKPSVIGGPFRTARRF